MATDSRKKTGIKRLMKVWTGPKIEKEVNLHEGGIYLQPSGVSVIRLDHEMFLPSWSHEER